MSLDKPARVQVDPETIPQEDAPPQTGTVFNIWYNKWSGGGNQFQLVKAKYKLNVEKDSGYTKANKTDGLKFFCLFFAKGMCTKGKKCEYLHRIPNEFDFLPQTVDCFGREKFSEYKDDMSGIGSFNHVNKTLYIGGLIIKDNTHDLLNKNFRKLGKIVKINVINNKNCGFITFKDEINAQFAKEAMIGQSLYENDILNIKWANEDPNPAAIKQKKRQHEEETFQIVENLLTKFDQSKKIKPNQQQEPEIEEPKEFETPVVEKEIKQIEASNSKSTILNEKSLNYLSLLGKVNQTSTQKKETAPLVSGYESSDDDE
ncbi:Pre-mRNA-splicing factor [Wickerhamomyces ciferrii]|uniref:Pre-mRNA-splicing factor CWC2 n=1 Tax=Wickerhamomyces ciferrii (strain ATCC 14091 / BCRC 22168 / CBS 111 / JCM 3599 / NBRC 0793 / NRRL Y-1031 F-60-10) TaxID=1206466 RepID=K0KN33_WICCF|nr:Pre-mRNA-splicing factor [Wickerhamomyces ciferrii]CCH46675.1 Pre-mRNA-splicing factor [Wickerhamomyces ciferrii]